jgi:ABC-type branched-subunit amino acid transport system ATPase component/ABC-type branched-subunit amino acid transport system permease subunit
VTAADLPAAAPAPVSATVPGVVRRGGPAVLLLALALFPVVFTNPAVTNIGVYTVMYLIAAVGWNIFSGYSGYISLGHAAYFGIGQYTVALIAVHMKVPGGWDQLALLPVAGLVATVAAVPIGYLLLRVRKYTFIILTIAVMFVLQLLAENTSWTSGSGGLALPIPLWQGNVFNLPFYYVALVAALVAMVVSWQVRRSKYGLGLLAIRDDEDRAGGLGVHVTRSKIVAYALSAFFVGAAGAIYAAYIGTVSPQFAFDPRFDLFLVVLVFTGGIGTFYGPVIGTLLLIPLEYYFELQFGNANLFLIIYGLLFIVILRLLPAGIVPGLTQLWRRFQVARMNAADMRAADASRAPASGAPGRRRARHGRMPAVRAEAKRIPPVRGEGNRLPPVRAEGNWVPAERANGNRTAERGDASRVRLGIRQGATRPGSGLEVMGVSKAYGGVRALNGCSMTFTAAAINGLIGPNGSGKTTLFNVITGYETADSGRVRLHGQDITGASPSRVFGLGVGRTFQITRVFPRLSVLENMHVATQRPGVLTEVRSWESAAERDWALDVLDFVGLARLAREPAGALSYGQQKLLEFASIIVARPSVMLLDEPAGGVNPTLLRHLTKRIRELNSQGVTFVIVEHDMAFVMSLCDRVMVMHQGSALTGGTPAQVRSDPAVLEAYLGAGAYLGS